MGDSNLYDKVTTSLPFIIWGYLPNTIGTRLFDQTTTFWNQNSQYATLSKKFPKCLEWQESVAFENFFLKVWHIGNFGFKDGTWVKSTQSLFSLISKDGT
jgi:hypothetical protein